jgi:ATP-dependent helicase HepA
MRLEKSQPTGLFEKAAIRNKLFPAMLAKARKLAEEDLTQLVAKAKETMRQQLQAEIDRLEDLRLLNDHVRPEEIEALRSHMTAIDAALDTATVRLDCLRLVFQTKEKSTASS